MAIKCTSGQIIIHFRTIEGLKKIYLALRKSYSLFRLYANLVVLLGFL